MRVATDSSTAGQSVVTPIRSSTHRVVDAGYCGSMACGSKTLTRLRAEAPETDHHARAAFDRCQQNLQLDVGTAQETADQMQPQRRHAIAQRGLGGERQVEPAPDHRSRRGGERLQQQAEGDHQPPQVHPLARCAQSVFELAAAFAGESRRSRCARRRWCRPRPAVRSRFERRRRIRGASGLANAMVQPRPCFGEVACVGEKPSGSSLSMPIAAMKEAPLRGVAAGHQVAAMDSRERAPRKAKSMPGWAS